MTWRLQVWSLISVFLLAGCYTWDATDKPISGVKITSPAAVGTDVPGNVYTFAGSIVANQPRHLYYGIQYRPHGYETYFYPGFEQYAVALDTTLSDQTATYSRSVKLPDYALPGQYLFYSYIEDARGRKSDTNRTFRDVMATARYPFVTPTSLAKSELPNLRNRGDLVTLTYRVNDGIGLDSIRFELCTVGDTGLFDCVLQSDTAFTSSGSLPLERYGTARFQIPFTAVSSQRYRARLIFHNRDGYEYTWQPLFQIN